MYSTVYKLRFHQTHCQTLYYPNQSIPKPERKVNNQSLLLQFIDIHVQLHCTHKVNSIYIVSAESDLWGPNFRCSMRGTVLIPTFGELIGP